MLSEGGWREVQEVFTFVVIVSGSAAMTMLTAFVMVLFTSPPLFSMSVVTSFLNIVRLWHGARGVPVTGEGASESEDLSCENSFPLALPLFSFRSLRLGLRLLFALGGLAGRLLFPLPFSFPLLPLLLLFLFLLLLPFLFPLFLSYKSLEPKSSPYQRRASLMSPCPHPSVYQIRRYPPSR